MKTDQILGFAVVHDMSGNRLKLIEITYLKKLSRRKKVVQNKNSECFTNFYAFQCDDLDKFTSIFKETLYRLCKRKPCKIYPDGLFKGFLLKGFLIHYRPMFHLCKNQVLVFTSKMFEKHLWKRSNIG